MSRLFFVGDTHGCVEMKKLSNKHFPIARELTKKDIVFILGDAGFLWDDSKETKYWDDWAEDRPFSIVSTLGNHENYPAIRSIPTEDWNGAKIHRVRPHVAYIENGEIFNLNGFSFFCMGGATSMDKGIRTEGKNWWAEEIPSYKEMDYAARNLQAHNMKVDYILTHCAPNKVVQYMYPNSFESDPLTSYLDKYVDKCVAYKNWLCGHYHTDRTIFDKYYVLYNDFIELTQNGLEMRNS